MDNKTSKNQLRYLLLQQSYEDAWKEYAGHLEARKKNKWDYVILTAANKEQAAMFQGEIDWRLENNLIPQDSRYVVLPDPDGMRIGSGGASLHVLHYLAEQENQEKNNFFKGKRILVIHSGGDSRRIPQYSLSGKLFAPIPRELPAGTASTLFDEIMIGCSMIPGQMQEGMMMVSGESLLIYNGLQLDVQFSGAACVTVKRTLEESVGRNVLCTNTRGQAERVVRDLSPRQLQMIGLVDTDGQVSVSAGVALFDAELLYAMYGLISTAGRLDSKKYNRFINPGITLSIHSDFLGAMATKATFTDYLRETGENQKSAALEQCKRTIWEALHQYNIHLINVAPAALVYFDTTSHLQKLVTQEIKNFKYLGWKKLVHSACSDAKREKNSLIVNTLVTDASNVRFGRNCYVENCYIGKNTFIGDKSIVSCLHLFDVVIPADVVLHGLKEKQGGYVTRLYGILDNPKLTLKQGATYLGSSLERFMKKNQLTESDLWEKDEPKDLWHARLFVEGQSMYEATKHALVVHKMALGQASEETLSWFKESFRQSLASSYEGADGNALGPWRDNLQNYILVQSYVEQIRQGVPPEKAMNIFGSGLKRGQYKLLNEKANDGSLSDKLRIYLGLSWAVPNKVGHYDSMTPLDLEQKVFYEIRSAITEDTFRSVRYREDVKIIRDHVHLQMPVRVNWGGGWTDTPPFCLEHGGAVINAAIAVRNQLPIQVHVYKISEKKIQFESQNGTAKAEYTDLEKLQDCGNTYDLFALHKAALIVCGILPRENTGQSLEEILDNIGGGIRITTEVMDLPRGSGLGLNSILAGACIRALHMLIGEKLKEETLFQLVLAVEQMMGTGGGWQDGIGGLVPGIKLITSRPGIHQDARIDQVNIPSSAIDELNRRFVMVNTGLRRSAINVVKRIVKKYLSGDSATISALQEMLSVSVLMKFNLERGDIDGFAKLLNQQWDLSLKLYEETSNVCIEAILQACEDLIDARFIAGVGGGGFLQLILKKDVSKKKVHERLAEVFPGTDIDVWDVQLWM